MNKIEQKLRSRLYQRRYRIKHKGHILEYQRQYRETHESELKEYRDFKSRNRKYYHNEYDTPVDWFMKRNERKFNEGQRLDY